MTLMSFADFSGPDDFIRAYPRPFAVVPSSICGAVWERNFDRWQWVNTPAISSPEI